MRRNLSRYLTVLIVGMAGTFGLTPPAHAGMFDDDVARKQIADQTRRLEETRNEIKTHVDTLSSRMAKMEEAMRGSLVTQQSMLELVNQIELLKREIQSLRGQIEVVNNGVENNAKRQRDMYVDLDGRLRRIEQPAQPGGASIPAAPAASDVAATAPPTVTAPAGAALDESRVYEAAQQLRRNGNFQGAIGAFQAFLGQYPRSTLAHRAQYWIGDSYFNLRDYKNAIASQQKVMSAYPDSASSPDALLNIASAQAELGDTKTARRTMDSLVNRYPSSEAAEKAKRRIATLR